MKSGETKRFGTRPKGKGAEKSTFVISGAIDAGGEWVQVTPESRKRSQEAEQSSQDRDAPKVRVVVQTASTDSRRKTDPNGAGTSSTLSPLTRESTLSVLVTRESLTAKTVEELREELRAKGLSTQGRKEQLVQRLTKPTPEAPTETETA